MWSLKMGEMEINSLGQQLEVWGGRGRVKCDAGSSNWNYKSLQLFTLYKYRYTPIHTITYMVIEHAMYIL